MWFAGLPARPGIFLNDRMSVRCLERLQGTPAFPSRSRPMRNMPLLLAVALIVAPPNTRPVSAATWSPNNEYRPSAVSERYDKAIDQALYDKRLQKAMQNICRGC
jgi:hypothetical protein